MKFERKLVYGIGVNDSTERTEYMKDGKRVKCPIYVMWVNMFKRCYSEAYLETHKSYIGCYVSDKWVYFTKFKEWVLTQDWKGKNLDKDLLFKDNKEYGPDTCVFVPSYINTAIGMRKLYDNGYPEGVSPQTASGKLVGSISVEGRRVALGYFTCPKTAHKAWQIAKSSQIETVALSYSGETGFDQRVFDALMQKVLALREDLLENRETVSL